MGRTRDLGPVYLHAFRYPADGFPLLDRATSVEVEPPFREGNGVALRLGRRFALVVGWWRELGSVEDEALLRAVRGVQLDLDPEEIGAW